MFIMHGSERAYPTHDQLKHSRESIALGSPPSAPMTPTPPPVAYSSPPTVPRVAVSFEYFKLGSAPKSKRSWTKRWAPMNVVSSRGERYFEFFQKNIKLGSAPAVNGALTRCSSPRLIAAMRGVFPNLQDTISV
jgi:hypothetical protein